MPVELNSAVQTAPGVYVSENAVGPVPTAIASFNRVYMVGSASGVVVAPNTPTQVISRTDFENQFTSSAAVNLNTIDLFFANAPNGILYYVKAAIAPIATVTIDIVAAGTYTVTIDSQANSYIAGAEDTAQDIIENLVSAINNNTAINTVVEAEFEIDDAGVNVFDNSQFYIRQLDPAAAVFAIATTGDLTASAVAAPATPSYWDYIYAIQNSFNEDMEQGFLVCPEAFYTLTRQYERTQVANAMEGLAASENYDWMALVDSGPPATVNTKAKVKTEGMLYGSARGHLAYFAPWIKDLDNDYVSPAMACAVVALRRYASEGFNQPPAGAKYPLRGVSGPDFHITKSGHADLNPNQINVIKTIKGVGTVVYGSRTRSVNPFYRFINTRIILNIYARTLFDALSNGGLVFSAIDGRDVLFSRIRETADQVAYRFWAGNAFFGVDPAAAFLNVCDRSNNPDLDLENGIVRVDSYVAPTPTGERIFVGVFRTAIGSVAAIAA
jgi:phage tail sheath protein FI